MIQVANLTRGTKRENPNRNRVYDAGGIAPCIVDYSGGQSGAIDNCGR